MIVSQNPLQQALFEHGALPVKSGTQQRVPENAECVLHQLPPMGLLWSQQSL